jgi:hypothetical protein
MAEQEPQSQAMEIRTRFGEQRAAILNELFNTTFEAAEIAAKRVANTLSKNVSKDAREGVFMSDAQDAARAIREDAKGRYIQSELEEQAALSALAEHLEEFLAPESISAADVATASQLTEEQLISAADAIAAVPNNDNALKTFLAVARQRDFLQATHHIAGFDPDWQMALVDLDIANESTEKPIEDIASEFSSFAKDEPDGPSLLAAAQSDKNLMSLIR